MPSNIEISAYSIWADLQKIRETVPLVYNITNSVRFDAFSALPAIDSAASFGKYASTLTRPRVMEFALRLSF